jgi:hypothetical protein
MNHTSLFDIGVTAFTGANIINVRNRKAAKSAKTFPLICFTSFPKPFFPLLLRTENIIYLETLYLRGSRKKYDQDRKNVDFPRNFVSQYAMGAKTGIIEKIKGEIVEPRASSKDS